MPQLVSAVEPDAIKSRVYVGVLIHRVDGKGFMKQCNHKPLPINKVQLFPDKTLTAPRGKRNIFLAFSVFYETIKNPSRARGGLQWPLINHGE